MSDIIDASGATYTQSPVRLLTWQPVSIQPNETVTRTILIAGNAVAFEGTLSISVSEGHDEYSSFTQVGGLALRQFQGEITIPEDNAFKLTRLFLTLADDTGNDNGPAVTIPILFGPKILPGYGGWRPYTVKSGDNLTKIYAANIKSIENKELASARSERRIDRFPWFLGAALVLLALEFLIAEGRSRRREGEGRS